MADNRVFPWAAELDADQLAAFIEDLWGAASGDDDLKTLDAIEQAITKHRPEDMQPPNTRDMRCPLTKRQIATLTEIASGATYESAAHTLGIPINTARARCCAIYDRLGVQNAAAAVAIAAHFGWLPDLRIPEPIKQLRKRRPQTWHRIHQAAAKKMRARPGEPLDIGPYTTRQGARQAVARIRGGWLYPYQPAGTFAAEPVRDQAGVWHVRARYLGTDSINTVSGAA